MKNVVRVCVDTIQAKTVNAHTGPNTMLVYLLMVYIVMVLTGTIQQRLAWIYMWIYMLVIPTHAKVFFVLFP